MAVTATADVLAEAVGEAVGITAVIEAMRGHAGHARMQMVLRVQNPGFSVKDIGRTGFKAVFSLQNIHCF